MKIIGHRGAKGLAPENTVKSLKKALAHLVDEVEFDLRVTSDGVVVLHHDPFLQSPSGTKVWIAKQTYKRLLEHKPDLATLKQAAATIDHRVPMMMEVKREADIVVIISAVRSLLKAGWLPNELYLASFDFQLLKQLHATLPEVPLVINESWSGVRASWRARQLDTKRLNMNQRWLWRGFIHQMHKNGWEIYPYTLNDPNKAKLWSKYGIAGVITDYPDRFK